MHSYIAVAHTSPDVQVACTEVRMYLEPPLFVPQLLPNIVVKPAPAPLFVGQPTCMKIGTGGFYQLTQSYMCKQGSYMSFA